MKRFIVIDQLRLNEDGTLVCKKPSGRSYQKAHFKQGDLDGACGAYSLAMVFNVLGVLEAEDIYRNTDEHDKRTVEWKLIRTLNDQGLYPNGLNPEEIVKIVTQTYSKYVTIERTGRKKGIPLNVKECIDENVPVILQISYNKYESHWIVAVGYVIDEVNNMVYLLTLDPGNDSPKYSLWNGLLDLKKNPSHRYGFTYLTDTKYLVSLDEAIIIRKR